ncbi:MAG: ribosome rescue protein RqcH [Thermoplasmata archaeon]
MKELLTSPDIHSWISANSQFIVGSFVKKIALDQVLVIRLHNKEFGNRDLYLDREGLIYFGEKKEMEIKGISKFLMEEFENLKIESIEQPNFDRIVKINFFGRKSIVFEMFGKGNIIFTKENKIIFALEYKEWKTRKIKKDEEYVLPPSPINPLKMDYESFSKSFEGSKDIVVFLATKFNLSHYAEHICSTLNIPKEKKIYELNEEEKTSIFEAIKKFLFSIDGKGYFCNGKIMCIKIGECEEFQNINDAILRFLEGKIEENEEKRIEKEQRKKLEEYKEKALEYRKIADEIIGKIDLYNSIFDKLRRKEKINELISIDGKIAKIKIDENSPILEVDFTKKPSEIAQFYYSEAKKLEEKINSIINIVGKIKKKKVKEKKVIERKRFWFEKYRWFISSEGILVLAGRDAKTNEEVVKKYLGEKDYYVHADVHGAPSVVVKDTKVSEKTLIEAGIFGLCHSKVWSSGYLVGDAYWVTFSQVSKMAESGEYVAKGAWVIRGKRNYMRNLKLEIGVGKIKYENVDLLMAGPIDAIKSKTSKYLVIIPGETKKEELAKIISEKFNWPLDDVMAILPPGSGKIMEDKNEETVEHSNNCEK